MPALFQNVDCISLTVPDLEQGLAFYRDSLGLKLLWRTETACGLGMEKGVTEIVLTTANNQMVDLKVESVRQALACFTAAGGTVAAGPFDIDIGECAVVRDPWGNEYCVLDMTKGTYDTRPDGMVSGVSRKEEQRQKE